MILNKLREIQLCVFAKMLSLCWLNYIYFDNFYILSHNKITKDNLHIKRYTVE